MSGPWTALLQRRGGKPGGPILPCLANIATIFAHDPKWRNVLAYDEFVDDIVALKEPPWPADLAPDRGPQFSSDKARSWTDSETRLATAWLTREYNFTPSSRDVGEGLHVAAGRTVRHPLRDWLTSLKWDRKPRVDALFVRYGGAEDIPYVRAVGKSFMIGAVARVMRPGSKVDSMPILEGAQGLGKSTFIRELASEQYYLESTVEIGHKDGYQILRRKWIVELAELDSLTKAEISRAKQFLSQCVDTYRPSYGHATRDFLRQNVFIGTINPNGYGYLKDETGARRFWPIHLKKVDLKTLRADRAQLWAEAVFRYRQAEVWHLKDPKLIAEAARQAEERRERHPWETPAAEWLASRKASDQIRGVTTFELLTRGLELETGRIGKPEEMRAAILLKLNGWTERHRDWKTPGAPYRFRRPDAPQMKVIDGAKASGKTWAPEAKSKTIPRPADKA